VTAYEDTTGVRNLEGEDRLTAAVWTLRTVARSLCFAHGRGVIHGGLTPGSVVRSSIISEPHAWRFPRVTDWGYVSLLREGAPPESVPDRYLAPEHLDAEAFGGVDGITDVYGFGLVAYETLVGRAPFTSEGEETTPREELSVPTALDRRLPDVESFLRRCLADRKPERFETVEAMMTAFRSATEGVDV
jgi:serine/threonine-protein kinase